MKHKNLCLLIALCVSATFSLAQKRMDGGRAHSIYLCNNNQVYTMGDNTDGQLGTGNNTASNTPVATSISNAVAVATGYDFSLAVLSDSTVVSWGDNQYGQLGIGNNTDRTSPTPIPNLSGVIAVEGGFFHGMALKADGTVWCWGRNSNGQLGNGNNTNTNTPVQATGMSNAVAIASSGYFSMALRADSTVWCWGSGNNGQMGDGSTNSRNTPFQVPNMSGVVQIAASGYHAVAVKADGTVWSWGYNVEGQMGIGTTASTQTTPVQMLNISNAVEAAAGCHHTLIRLSNGTVYSVGRNTNGALGNGGTGNTSTPVQVTGLSNVCDIEAGCWHSLATQNSGSMNGWGRNTQGQLGLGNNTNNITSYQSITTGCGVGCSFALAASITGNSLLCNGVCDGSASVNATGGAAPYTYQWDANANNQTTATATNLCAGSYSVTVTDNNNDTQVLSVSLSQPAAVVVTLDSVSNISCNGANDGYLVCSAVGGVGTFGFTWNNGSTSQGISGLTPGTYCVTVTDSNGCVDTLCQTITQPNSVVIATDTLQNSSCNGADDGMIVLSASGGTPSYTYLWSNAATGNSLNSLAPGTYCATVSDANACTDTICVSISQPDPLSLVLASSQSSDGACDGSATVTMSGGTSPYTYQWNAAGGNQTTATADSLCAGEACVTITDANGCQLDTCVTILTGLPDPFSYGVKVYPNPNQGQFQVEGAQIGDLIQVFDLQGREVLRKQAESRLQELHLMEQSKGIYLLRINGSRAFRLILD